MNNDKLIEAMARGVWGARQLRLLRDDPEAAQLSYDELCPSVQADLLWEARAALAALQETHAVVPREPVAWRRPSISGRHRWIFAYAREAAHFNQGEWEPLYAAAPQPEEAL